MSSVLRAENLTVKVAGEKILEDVNLTIRPGEIHALLGPNGSGKTSLACAILGHPAYRVTNGRVLFQERDITGYPTEERARMGLFLSFQEPPEVGGISVEDFLRAIVRKRSAMPAEGVLAATTSRQRVRQLKQDLALVHAVKETLPELGLAPPFLARPLHEGFSGGEKKKSELLQVLAFRPRLAIFDEIDSGLDLDALAVVSRTLQEIARNGTACLFISHHLRLFDTLQPQTVHILSQGRKVYEGDAAILGTLRASGYQRFS